MGNFYGTDLGVNTSLEHIFCWPDSIFREAGKCNLVICPEERENGFGRIASLTLPPRVGCFYIIALFNTHNSGPEKSNHHHHQ